MPELRLRRMRTDARRSGVAKVSAKALKKYGWQPGDRLALATNDGENVAVAELLAPDSEVGPTVRRNSKRTLWVDEAAYRNLQTFKPPGRTKPLRWVEASQGSEEWPDADLVLVSLSPSADDLDEATREAVRRRAAELLCGTVVSRYNSVSVSLPDADAEYEVTVEHTKPAGGPVAVTDETAVRFRDFDDGAALEQVYAETENVFNRSLEAVDAAVDRAETLLGANFVVLSLFLASASILVSSLVGPADGPAQVMAVISRFVNPALALGLAFWFLTTYFLITATLSKSPLQPPEKHRVKTYGVLASAVEGYLVNDYSKERLLVQQIQNHQLWWDRNLRVAETVLDKTFYAQVLFFGQLVAFGLAVVAGVYHDLTPWWADTLLRWVAPAAVAPLLVALFLDWRHPGQLAEAVAARVRRRLRRLRGR